jgi:AhpD family alkylhydroperoxidase
MAIFDKKTTEIAAISAAVAGNCIPCLKYHLAQGRKEGVTNEEILEIMNIARMVKQKPLDEINEVAAKYLGIEEKSSCGGECSCISKGN